MRISDWSSDVCSSDLPIGHGAIVRGGIAVDLDPIPSFGMADVVDHDVVMLAPEEGDRREAFSPAEHVACRRRTLPLGDRPMLDADIVAGLGVGRSDEHTSALQSLMSISYAVFCLKKKST